VVAGEASGDQAAATVVRALRDLRPEWRISAVGGAKLAGAGAEIILPYEEVAVMGFAEVVSRLPAIRRHMRRLTSLLKSGSVDLLLPVDFPGFNLRLAARARKAGVPVLYFVAPQVWAWGKRRVDSLRRNVDRLAVILPFEEEWFRREGLASRFVGHPIMEDERPFAPDAFPLRLGLLPGSRAQEIGRHLPLMLSVARELQARLPGLSCELLEAPGLPAGLYDSLLGGASGIERRRTGSAEFLGSLGAALVASGTATLETAVAGVPMAVVYRTSTLSYWLARRLVSVEHVALANLVAAERVAPEFIQEGARVDAIVATLAELLSGGEARESQRASFRTLREKLGGPGCGEKTAQIAVQLLEGA